MLKKNKNGFLSVAVRQKSSAGSEKNILTSVFKDLPPTTNTVNDFVWQNLERWPDKTATVRYISFAIFRLVVSVEKMSFFIWMLIFDEAKKNHWKL